MGSADWQMKLFKARETFLMNELAGKLFAQRQAGKNIFESWMLNESDLVQSLAQAWGENIAIEQFNKIIQTASPGLVPTFQKLFSLFALDRINADGVLLLQNGLISAQQSHAVTAEIQKLCTELGKDALELTKGFGIPGKFFFYFFSLACLIFSLLFFIFLDHMHHAPIANDWIKYNSVENNGELANQDYRSNSKL